jgi:DNA-directed RNA polymerase subunit omega
MSIQDPLHNKYSLVKGAARRARQLQSGAQPMMATKSMKACRVAQDEISQGRVTFVVGAIVPKDLSVLEPEL